MRAGSNLERNTASSRIAHFFISIPVQLLFGVLRCRDPLLSGLGIRFRCRCHCSRANSSARAPTYLGWSSIWKAIWIALNRTLLRNQSIEQLPGDFQVESTFSIIVNAKTESILTIRLKIEGVYLLLCGVFTWAWWSTLRSRLFGAISSIEGEVWNVVEKALYLGW